MEELEFFVTVVTERGFSAAAARLDTTTAAVRRRIRALEQRLGVRLLQRTLGSRSDFCFLAEHRLSY